MEDSKKEKAILPPSPTIKPLMPSGTVTGGEPPKESAPAIPTPPPVPKSISKDSSSEPIIKLNTATPNKPENAPKLITPITPQAPPTESLNGNIPPKPPNTDQLAISTPVKPENIDPNNQQKPTLKPAAPPVMAPPPAATTPNTSQSHMPSAAAAPKPITPADAKPTLYEATEMLIDGKAPNMSIKIPATIINDEIKYIWIEKLEYGDQVFRGCAVCKNGAVGEIEDGMRVSALYSDVKDHKM